MISRSILSTHPLTALKKEISKTNIKGYSKMKKADIIDLMLKPVHRPRFNHIKIHTTTRQPRATRQPKQLEDIPLAMRKRSKRDEIPLATLKVIRKAEKKTREESTGKIIKTVKKKIQPKQTAERATKISAPARIPQKAVVIAPETRVPLIPKVIKGKPATARRRAEKAKEKAKATQKEKPKAKAKAKASWPPPLKQVARTRDDAFPRAPKGSPTPPASFFVFRPGLLKESGFQRWSAGMNIHSQMSSFKEKMMPIFGYLTSLMYANAMEKKNPSPNKKVAGERQRANRQNWEEKQDELIAQTPILKEIDRQHLAEYGKTNAAWRAELDKETGPKRQMNTQGVYERRK
jgi:hypothetical protein